MPKDRERKYTGRNIARLFAYGRSWAHDAKLGRKEGNHFRPSCRRAASDVEASQSAMGCVLCAHVGMRVPAEAALARDAHYAGGVDDSCVQSFRH